jgi:outer membrane protein
MRVGIRMTTRTGRFSLKPIAALLLGATCAALLPPATAQTSTNATVQSMKERAATSARNDVLQLYREALQNDAAYASARSQQLATQERVPQARSALLPNVGLTGRVDQNYYSSTIPDVSSNFQVYGGGVNLAVPVYRPQNWEALEQARLSVMQSEAQLAQAQQDLVLRVATAYFNALGARDQLIALEAARLATLEQLQQAKREFEVGTKTIIDTNEAQARYDQIVAQQQVAIGTLIVRRSELQTIIGREVDTLSPLRDRPNLQKPTPAEISAWVNAAEQNSFAVQVARANFEIASREIQRARDGYKPTVDVVAGYNVNKFNGTQSSDFNPRIGAGSVGLQLNWPIYQGGLTQSRVREAVALQDRFSSDLEGARRTAANSARQAYTGVNFGLSQVQALESAEVSARTQLESTQLGYQVGVRIQLDVLNATTQLVQTQRDLKRARYDFLLSALQLKAATGTLGEDDLVAVNGLLDPEQPIEVPTVLTAPPAPRSSRSLPSTAATAAPATSTSQSAQRDAKAGSAAAGSASAGSAVTAARPGAAPTAPAAKATPKSATKKSTAKKPAAKKTAAKAPKRTA